MEHRQDRRPAVEHHLPVGGGDGVLDLGLIALRVLPPVVRGPVLPQERLAAGVVRADIGGVAVIAAILHLIVRVGPGRHRLGAEGVLGEGGRASPPAAPPGDSRRTLISVTVSPSSTRSVRALSTSPGGSSWMGSSGCSEARCPRTAVTVKTGSKKSSAARPRPTRTACRPSVFFDFRKAKPPFQSILCPPLPGHAPGVSDYCTPIFLPPQAHFFPRRPLPPVDNGAEMCYADIL